MKLFRKRAFTLTELLVVVIVLGVLAAVAVPKFSRVLETRRTTEAESILSAVRTEQEARCLMGKKYLGPDKRSQVSTLANVGVSPSYDYQLLANGAIEANRGTGSNKKYTLKMWYKTGEICCEGSECGNLSKAYPACGAGPENDECVAESQGVQGVVEAAACSDSQSCSSYYGEEGWTGTAIATWTDESGVCSGSAPGYASWDTSDCQKEETTCETTYGPSQKAGTGVIDTCPGGDDGAKYSCGGGYAGTCVDVYQVTLSAGGLKLFGKDPFRNMLLAYQPGDTTISGGTICGDGKTECPKGYMCVYKSLVWGCEKGDSPQNPLDPSDPGIIVLPDDPPGDQPFDPGEPSEPSVDTITYKRSVTCCGNESATPTDPDPEPGSGTGTWVKSGSSTYGSFCSCDPLTGEIQQSYNESGMEGHIITSAGEPCSPIGSVGYLESLDACAKGYDNATGLWECNGKYKYHKYVCTAE